MASSFPSSSDYHDLPAEAARIAYLIAGFLKNTLTPQEHRELDAWVEASDRNMRLFEDLTEDVRRAEVLAWADGTAPPLGGHRRKVNVRRFAMPAAAALLLLAAGTWWVFLRPQSAPPTVVGAAAVPAAPGGITLYPSAAGAPLALSHRDTAVGLEGGGRIAVHQGILRYTATPPSPGVHELRTPAATTFGLVLPDSTRVWLNAGSCLRYPPRFSARERRVELQGEAYFEVAPDKARPFRVHTESGELQVLGTAFTVEADGPSLVATLLEGSLRVGGKDTSALLRAGEQVRYSPERGWQKIARADVARALDWQSGVFVFQQTPLQDVLRELARWYGTGITLRGSRTVHLTATIPRHLPLPRVLSILEGTGRVRFRPVGAGLEAVVLSDTPR